MALAYEDVSAHVQPATVHLRSLDATSLAREGSYGMPSAMEFDEVDVRPR